MKLISRIKVSANKIKKLDNTKRKKVFLIKKIR